MDGMIMKRKRRRPVKRRLLLRCALIIAAFVTAAALVNSAVRAPAISCAMERARAMAEQALADAAASCFESGGISLPELEKTVSGGVLAITSDQTALNIAAARVTRQAQRNIEGLAAERAEVDLGAASGFVPLAGSGAKVAVSFSPVGSVGSRVTASLKSAGINQSLFSVELVLTARIRVFIAGADEAFEIESTVPLQRMVLVGQTPQVYTNVANEDDMLNLIPNELP